MSNFILHIFDCMSFGNVTLSSLSKNNLKVCFVNRRNMSDEIPFTFLNNGVFVLIIYANRCVFTFPFSFLVIHAMDIHNSRNFIWFV
jgi:hypothetical protein